MKDTLCCVFNYAPHYRESIYRLMDEQLKCHFFFGNNVKSYIRKLDYSIFTQPAIELDTVWYFNRVYIIKGSASLIFKPYKRYLITGEIHCLSAWFILILSKLLGKKVYLWTHGFYGKEKNLQVLIKKIFISMTAGVFLYGNHAKEIMKKKGINPEKLHVIYNSLDYEKILEVRKRLKKTNVYINRFGNSNPVLLFLGRLTRVKKIDLLINVLNDLHNVKKYYNLIIIGEGDERKNLEELVDKLLLRENVWFFGECYDEDILGQLIYNADLCISPGNVGLTAIHCLSYGTPVITHNNFSLQGPEFEIIRKGITGDFFIENDQNSLKSVTEDWIYHHPEKCNRLIESCHKLIDEYFNPFYQITVLKRGLGVKNDTDTN